MSRAMVGRAAGLDWPQTFVLKAAGDLAMERWERRLTLDQVAHRLAVTTRIARRQIEAALGPLSGCGYLYADDAPENPEIVLTLTSKGLEEYCYRFVQGYGRISLEILAFVCRDPGLDVAELARLAGRAELLVEQVLEIAEANSLLRLARHGQYVTVREVKPQLRRLVSGAA